MNVPLETILYVALMTPQGDPSVTETLWGLNLFLWGSYGIGKSSRVRQAAKLAGLPIETLIAATRQPEDFSGVIVPDGHGDAVLKSFLPGIQRLIRNGEGVLFLDELSCAKPAVQAASLSLVLEGIVGDDILPPRVRKIAAGNPVGKAAGGWELENALKNRFCHINVDTPTVAQWKAHYMRETPLQTMKIDKAAEHIQQMWPMIWPEVQGMVTGFLVRKPEHLHKEPEDGSEENAFPTPRTWDFASWAIATVKCLYPPVDKAMKATHDSLIITFLTGCVGEAAAVEMSTWLRDTNIPPPLECLEKGFDVDRARLDIALAVHNSMFSYALGQPDERERDRLVGLFWTRLESFMSQGFADVMTVSMRTLIDKGFSSKHPVVGREAARVISSALKQGYGNSILNKIQP